MTKLGIVTPTLNAERYFRPFLASIWRNVPPGVVVDHVVVDGGSSDATLSVAAEFPSRVMTGRDGGMYEAINRGMDLVDGDILTYVNADDEIPDGALAAVVDHFARHPASNWLCGALEYIDGRGDVLGRMAPVAARLDAFAALGWCCLPQQSIWFRKSFYEHVGPYDITYRYAGDYEWIARALAAEPPSLTSVVLGRFRLHEANLSAASSAAARESARVTETYSQPTPATRLRAGILRAKVNLRNPAYFVAKKTGRIRFWS